MRLLSLVAGVLLLAGVLFVIRDLTKPKPPAPPSGGSGSDPEPRDPPRPQ